jgi:adenine-specific DNA methylase
VDQSIANQDIAKVILVYLALILGRLADKCANLVVYNSYGEKIEHVFGRTALPMVWDFVELNVFSQANGDWFRQTEWVIRYLKNNSWKAISNASVRQESATNLNYSDNYFDAVITDPPYYDNVPYADLSDFFYIWLKRVLGNIYPNLFSTPLTPKKSEIVANKGRQQNPREFFENQLSKAFQEIYRVLKPNGIAIFVYAHKSITGWRTMLEALIQSGFTITSSWPINTEMRTRLRAQTSAALASSIYLVCRKTGQQEKGYFREIANRVEKNVFSRLNRFWNDGIRGGDFFISAIGPGMEIFSQYRLIQRYSGDKVTIEDQLQFIRKISTDFLFQKVINDSQNEALDHTGQFYLAFRWTYGEATVEFGEVQKLAQAYGINLEAFSMPDGFIQLSGSRVSVKNALQRSRINKNEKCIVDLMHQAILAWKENDKNLLNLLFTTRINAIQNIFGPFCQAVAECLPPHNQEKQLLEGLLVSQYLRV